MKKIILTQNKVALIDDEDFEKLIKFNWHAVNCVNTKSFIAATNIGGRKNHRTVKMHRFIMDAPKGMVVDHINHDTLDNRKSNLRICTYLENSRNSRTHIKTASGFKGVYWHNQAKKWGVQIHATPNRSKHIGLFTDKLEAAKAYNEAAKKYFGEFAYLNKI